MRPESFKYIKPESLTNQKPTVVYIGEDYDSYDNKGVYLSVLENDLGCQVVESSYHNIFNKNKGMKFLSKNGSITTFIIKEGEYDSKDSNYPNKIIKDIRNISAEAPIVLIKYHKYDKPKYQKLINNGTISVASFYGGGVFNFVKKSLENFHPKPNYFGVESYNAIEPTVRNIYKSCQSEENEVYLTDDQITCQTIRLRLLNNGEIIKNVFDSNLGQSPNPQELNISRETIQKEKEIIRQIPSRERREFVSKVYQSIYFDNNGDRIPYYVVGHGENTNDFAIDPETLEFYITTKFGEHGFAKSRLVHRLVSIDEFRGNINDDDKEEEIECRLISGFIYHNIPNFSSPILVTGYYDFKDDEYRKVVNFLNKQNFITIDQSGKLIE